MSKRRRAEIRLRPLESSDIKQVIALWQAAFGKTLKPDLWHWKFQGVFGNRAIVAEHGSGQLIAMFGGVPYRAHCQGKKVEIVHLWDNMSHPQFRGILGGRRGVYVKTVDAFIKTYCGTGKTEFLYGFPGERHFRLGQHTLNYGRLFGGAVCLQGELDGLSNPVKACHVERLMAPDCRLDQIAANFDQVLPFWVRRDRSFIDWRYFQHPCQSYWIYGCHRRWRQDLSGLMVMTNTAQAREGVVVDFLIPPREKEALAFLAAMAQEWRWLGWQKIRVWMPSWSPFRKFWEATGFQEIPEPIGIIPTGRSFSSALDWTWASNNLFYTMGDGDLF